MKKKIWIRLVGVAALLAWGFGFVLFRATQLAPNVHVQAEVGIEMFMVYGLAAFLSLVWAILSLIDWTLRRQAALRATQVAQGLPGVAPRPWPANAAPHPAAPQAPAAVLCAFCRTHSAAWVCSRHQWPACLTCANAHLQSEPTCTYAPIAPAAPAPAAGPRAVVTSPLAGLR